MHRNNLLVLLVIVIIFGLTLWFILPSKSEKLGRQGLRLGLDLVGGVHLVYQADFPTNATLEQKTRDMDRALATIQSRIDKYGVTDPIIQQLGTDRILVQLPGFTDIDAAKGLVEQTGFLEFRQVELNAGKPVYLRDYLSNSKPEFFDKKEMGSRIFVDAHGNPVAYLNKSESSLKFTDQAGKTVDTIVLEKYGESLSWIAARGNNDVQLTGEVLEESVPSLMTETTGAKAEVNITWNTDGAKIFDQVAQRLYNSGEYESPQRALGIFLDDRLISDPQILSPSYSGRASITGNFTVEKATELANLLASGALPMPLKKPPLYQEKVSATLGANFIEMSVNAGVIGVALFMLFFIIY